MKRNKLIDVKRALALSSTFNFVLSCAKACLLPFLTLYFRQLGLAPAMTGIVMGTKHLISLVWSPVASLLSKHYNKRRMVINGSLVSSAGVALLLLLLPPVDVNMQTSTCNMSDVSVHPTQSVGDNLSMSSTGPEISPTRIQQKAHVPQSVVTIPVIIPNNPKSAPVTMSKPTLHLDDTEKSHSQIVSVVNSGVGESNTSHSVEDHTSISLVTAARNKRSSMFESNQAEEERKNSFGFLGSLKVMDIQHQLFFLILIIVSVWEFTSAPLEWTVDDGLYEYLDFADASDRFSSSRVWGLLGAACGVGGTGFLVSQLRCHNAAQTPRSAGHFYSYAGLLALALPVATYLPLYLNKKRDRANGLLKAMQLVRGSPQALLCAVTILLVGVASSVVDNFLLWQMQDHGSSELHMGLSLALALFSQAAFPLLAGHVSKLLSPGKVLTVGAASLGLQCFYYSFLWGAWAVLPAQLLSCFSSGALLWAVKIQCEDVATPGVERSVSRVYISFCLLLGNGLGSFAGGFVAQRFGLSWLFRGVAVILMAWCVCLPLLLWKVPRKRRINYSRLLAADASEASDSESEQERDWLAKAMQDDRSNNNVGRRMNL